MFTLQLPPVKPAVHWQTGSPLVAEQVPLLRQTSDAQGSSTIPQVSLVVLIGQTQVNRSGGGTEIDRSRSLLSEPLSTQVLPLEQGLLAHSSISV